MAPSTKETGTKVRQKAMGLFCSQMIVSIRGIGLPGNIMGMVCLSQALEQFMMENGKRGSTMGRAHLPGQIKASMLDTGRTEKKMVKGLSKVAMELIMKETG
jgi:hypothetical protein